MTTVGILGGGQLARMMALVGAPLGLRFVVFDPAADACAGQVAPLHVGAFDDAAALAEFADKVDVVTFDFENVPAASAHWLAERKPVFPNPARRSAGAGRQRLRQPQPDRRNRRLAALRRARPLRHRSESRRPALSAPLRRGKVDLDRHHGGGRQCGADGRIDRNPPVGR